MLATLIIVFREIIEAGLIIGIVLAATRGVHRRGLWITYGIAGGVAGACLVAAFADAISNAVAGNGQELFNAAILITAVIMLAWHNVWMSRHGREVAVHMREMGEEVTRGRRTLLALAVVVGIAVLREGSEIVLFLYGIAISGNEPLTAMLIGAVLGLGAGAVISAVMYFGLLRIPTRHMFRITSWLITLLAAGMAAQAVLFLDQAQVMTWLEHTAWDTSRFISDSGILGKVLHTLMGYTSRPSVMQVVAYAGTLAIVTILMKLLGHTHHHRQHPQAHDGLRAMK